VQQYEISNFARPMTHGVGLRDSRHNLKYWMRQPYLGFGVDGHSMLVANDELWAKGVEAVRFATPDSLEGYSKAAHELDPIAARMQQLRASRSLVNSQAALEESFFLGLRLNCGVSFGALREQFGNDAVGGHQTTVDELLADGLLELASGRLTLTSRGRLLSNEVFGRFLRDKDINHRDTEAQRTEVDGNGISKIKC
jgi:coproporphyrinogen III oxidase-like Fe-S oxidoreductase